MKYLGSKILARSSICSFMYKTLTFQQMQEDTGRHLDAPE